MRNDRTVEGPPAGLEPKTAGALAPPRQQTPSWLEGLRRVTSVSDPSRLVDECARLVREAVGARWVAAGIREEGGRSLFRFRDAGAEETTGMQPPEGLSSLRDVLEIALGSIRQAIEEAEAIVTHDPLPRVDTDESLLLQLFQNLVCNAVKFRGERAPRVHVTARQEGSEWVFSVRDNGIGIDRRFEEKIFQVFQRLHDRDVYPGSGIGLALCKRIVERLRGRIWFDSVVGEGSTFSFTLPAG